MVLVEVGDPEEVFELVIEPVEVRVLIIDRERGGEAEIEADELDVFDPRIVRVPVPLLEDVLDKGPDLVGDGEEELVFVCLLEDVEVIDLGMVRVVVGLPVVVLVDVSVLEDLGELVDDFDIGLDRVEVLVDVAVFVDIYIGDFVNIEDTCVVTVIKDDRVDVLEGKELTVGAIALSIRFLKDTV